MWTGDLSEYNSDHSGGDLALCNILAFWTQNDPKAIDRLFRKSKLMRPKWDKVHSSNGRTYGEMTIEKAIEWDQSSRKAINEKEFYTAAELLKTEFPEPRWAVHGLLTDGLNILAGKPKQGKSILALNFAVAVAAEQKALNKFRTKKGTVICFALEDTFRRIKARLEKIMSFREQDLHNLVFYKKIPRMDQGGLKDLEKKIRKYPDILLVIIDTFVLFRTQNKGKSSNIYDNDYRDISLIKSLADKHSISILLIHHMRKSPSHDVMDTFSGSFGLTGAADTLLALKRKGGRTDATLHITGRDVETTEYAIRFDPDSMSWENRGRP
jgi:RecA-family ATPase